MKKTIATLAAVSISIACTQQSPGSFRFLQIEEAFRTIQQINTKVDILWVIDNSASMDVAQNKLRNGFSQFVQAYMKPTWDIQLAVITTDTYMAHSAFTPYIDKTWQATVQWQSSYILSRISTYQNPSWNPNLVNLSNATFESGIKFGEMVPSWGPQYARLLPGMHDGPITGFCFEGMPYFFRGITQCAIRDDQTRYNGPENCLRPNTGENSLSQCVNTVQNDTVRSGKAIIHTKPPTGVPANPVWTQGLIDDSMINLTTGSVGHGSERGLGSLLQLLDDNESTQTNFFRPGSIRAIIFVADEDDQTMTLPSPTPAGFHPFTDYRCDQAGLLNLNVASSITGQNGYCCSNPTKNCSFGARGTSCPAKTVETHTYTPSLCPDPNLLVPIADVKSRLDAHFQALEKGGDPNYFVISIVPTTAQAIIDLQAQRDQLESSLGTIRTVAVDRGDRYIALSNLVENGSAVMNLGDADYSATLEAIGRTIIQKRGTFILNRPATQKSEMFIKIVHQNQTELMVQPYQFELSGRTIRITDIDLLLSLTETDTIIINYQPSSPPGV